MTHQQNRQLREIRTELQVALGIPCHYVEQHQLDKIHELAAETNDNADRILDQLENVPAGTALYDRLQLEACRQFAMHHAYRLAAATLEGVEHSEIVLDQLRNSNRVYLNRLRAWRRGELITA